MYRPGFELCGFDTLPVQRKQVVLRALLEALVVADWNYIWHREQAGEGLLPSIYEIGPRYVLKVRPAGIDSWQDIPRTLELGSGDCFAEGTPITLETGQQLPVEKVQIGMRVRTRSERIHTVTNRGLMKLNAKTFEVETKRGHVARVTANHRFWTRNRGWVPLRDLNLGDGLIELDDTGNQKDADIAEIRPAGRSDVYDLTVEEKHEVFAGAILASQCKDFACWRIAELRHAGYDDVFPHIKVTTVPDPKGVEPDMTVYHIQVRIHETIEDPSAVLGMPTNATYDQLRGDSGEASLAPISAGAFPDMFAGGAFGYHQEQFRQHPGLGGHPGYPQHQPNFGHSGRGGQQHPQFGQPQQFGQHPGHFGYHAGGIVNQFGVPYGYGR
jgi:hypothetical protein